MIRTVILYCSVGSSTLAKIASVVYHGARVSGTPGQLGAFEVAQPGGAEPGQVARIGEGLAVQRPPDQAREQGHKQQYRSTHFTPTL